MEPAALLISMVALAVSGAVGWRAVTLSRQANALPMLVDLFREHRCDQLAAARRFVYKDLSSFDISGGLAGIPEDRQALIRQLGCYYDNLGALVAHGIVDLDVVAGYLGSPIVTIWDRMEPLVRAERTMRREVTYDDKRWQQYFENLCLLIKQRDPATARRVQMLWRLDRQSRRTRRLLPRRPQSSPLS